MKLLYVEDKAVALRLMPRIAHSVGWECILATTGQEALARLPEAPDAVFTDLGLPDIPGLTLIHHIRTHWPHLPVVAVTAFARPEDRAQCLDAGCMAFVPKPFRVSDITALLQQIQASPTSAASGATDHL